MRVLVTGSDGFIGQHLVQALKSKGHKVYEFDIKHGSDLLNYDQLWRIFHEFQPDVVSHLAAQATVEGSEKNPTNDAMVNIVGTLNILRCCKEMNAKLVFHSSGAVYGNNKRIPTYEEVDIVPVSHYGVSKWCAENYVNFYIRKEWVTATITRFSSVYGYGRDRGPINVFVDRVLNGKPLVIYGTGKQTRDYTYVDDIVDGVIMCLEGELPWNDTYNLASETLTSVLDVMYALEEILGRKLEYSFKDEEQGDIHSNTMDCGKARVHGFKSRYTLKEGIKKLINEIKSKDKIETNESFRLG